MVKVMDANTVRLGTLVDKDESMRVITAALRPQIDAVYSAPSLFYASEQLASRTQGYPLEEINDYLRDDPRKSAQGVAITASSLVWLGGQSERSCEFLIWSGDVFVATLAR